MTETEGLTAEAGEMNRAFARIRREKSLFHLSLVGPNSLVMTHSPEQYAVASSYHDHGYLECPLSARVVVMKNDGKHEVVEFNGETPEDLVDFMSELCSVQEAL